MNNRIDLRLGELKNSGKKGLITFVTAGDPDLGTTYDLVLSMIEAGADLIELGIPFSDPVAEGPVIQEANIRALINSITLDDVFNLVNDLRKKTEIPIVFLMYTNSLYRYGAQAFFTKCRECGVDGVITPDLPYEEKEEFLPYSKEQNVHMISLVSPTSKERIKTIAQDAKGFLYCVSSLGVTGVRNDFKTDFQGFMDEVYKHTSIPAYLGFGVSSPEAVDSLKGFCDGVIVGSAIVKHIGESKSPQEAMLRVKKLTKELKEAL